MAVSAVKTSRHYLIDSVLRSCEVLRAFREPGESLSLRQVVERTELKKTTVFRLLRSLEHGGLLRRLIDGNYQTEIAPTPQRRFRLGFLANANDHYFGEEILRGLRLAAQSEQVQLVELDAHNRPKEALRQVDRMIETRVDAAATFQTNADIATSVASRLREANIPLIAIDVPHPGATFYGADNYRAGLLAGRALSRWAAANWNGDVQEIVLLEQAEAGPLVHSRLQGVLDRVQSQIHSGPNPEITYVDCAGRFDKAWDVARRLLQGKRKRRLFGAVNDTSALGVLQAIEEAGAREDCAVVGHGADYHGRQELRRPATRLIGTVAFFPEHYGKHVIELAVNLLSGKEAPSAVFVRHRVATPENVDRLYPNDSLHSPS